MPRASPISWAALAVAYLLALLAAPPARAFSFSVSEAAQCQDWTIKWDGGVPPFYLTLVPTIEVTGGHIQNMTLDIGGQTSAPYEITVPLPQPSGNNFVAVLSDATGFGTGGVTDVIMVKPSEDTSCLKTDAKLDFTFWTEPKDSPPQCSSMKIVWGEEGRTNATAPIGLIGVVPGGNAWEIPISQTPDVAQVNWTVNMKYGTQFMLIMTDAGTYGTGGSTVPLTVQYSSDSSCIDDNSPKTTVASTSSGRRTSASASTTSRPYNSSGSSSKGPSAGAIAGGVIGGVAALALAGLLIFCLMRRKKKRQHHGDDDVRMTERAGFLGRHRTTHGQSTYQSNARPPPPGFDIDDMDSPQESTAGANNIQPYTYTPPMRNSSEGTGGTSEVLRNSGGYQRRTEKDLLGAALSHGASTSGSTRGHNRSSSGGTGNGAGTSDGRNGAGGADLYTVSELALQSASSGRPVDREALMAILDPPPMYDTDTSTQGDSNTNRQSTFSDSTAPPAEHSSPRQTHD